ncbi:hypothetical protein ACM66Z_09595 [Sulfurovum sp. ST-21]|uniref:Uncharacterized protein n=1 Tax=Sulfurovum indicum TaxID=2779528 RepID=A0A7M1S2K2_9BACT|nr:hypothetical protein [Sulfurovum indicum]QOR61673.1 hypothetical protein IMZ28_09580 [Sulfurovum indicum]
MQKLSKLLPVALLLGFFFFGLDALIQSKPSSKNERVYKVVQQYSPYYLDKRFGGLQILSRNDPDFKEKPTNTTIFKEFERLEKEWGKKHLKVQNNTLLILDNNGSRLAELPLQSKEELLFIKNYYGVQP